MRRATILLFILSLTFFFAYTPIAPAQEDHHHALSVEEVGSVHFPTSCAASVEGSFNRAVALLHSFQYEQARHGFGEVAASDPQCAMAQWGIAMSQYHGLWDNGDIAAGRIAMRKAQEIAAAVPKTSAREKDYIAALAEIYSEDGKTGYVHAQAFEQKMGALQAAYPDDTEAAIFHALTLAIVAPKTDKTFADQRKCGEILEPIFAQVTAPSGRGPLHHSLLRQSCARRIRARRGTCLCENCA